MVEDALLDHHGRVGDLGIDVPAEMFGSWTVGPKLLPHEGDPSLIASSGS